jgi:hypothetical protein
MRAEMEIYDRKRFGILSAYEACILLGLKTG